MEVCLCKRHRREMVWGRKISEKSEKHQDKIYLPGFRQRLITKDSLIYCTIYWHEAVTDCFMLRTVLACVCCKIVAGFKTKVKSVFFIALLLGFKVSATMKNAIEKELNLIIRLLTKGICCTLHRDKLKRLQWFPENIC